MGALSNGRLRQRYSLVLLGIAILGAGECASPPPTPGAAPAVARTPQSSAEDALGQTRSARILPPFRTRGVWLQAEALNSPQAADQILSDVARGNFNTLFVNVVKGGKMYDANQQLPAGFDPLADLMPKAHALGIEVHAWFVIGQIGWPTLAAEPTAILATHPEWMARNACGAQSKWLSAANPDARNSIQEVILKFLQEYPVDGIHLDYIRYPGEGWSFDDYSRNQFQALYGVDPEILRQPALPAYAHYSGHPLLWPGAAQVLAVFDSGEPALTLNKFGDGETLVFHWDVSRCEVGAAGVIFQRSLERFTATSANIYLLQDAEAGDAAFYNVRAWIRNLGWEPAPTTPEALATLAPAGVIVIPNVYSIAAPLAKSLSDFVRGGGNAIFLDGPIYSMNMAEIRDLTGMQMRGRTFDRDGRWLIAQQRHPLLPTADPLWNETVAAQWNEFRTSGVTQWVRDIRRETRSGNDLRLTAAVFADPTGALTVGQDWQRWLAEDMVDTALPMAYVEDFDELAQILAAWRDSPHLLRIVPGLITYEQSTGQPKPVQDILGEIEMVRSSGAQGVALFDLAHLDETVLDALSAGPFAPQGYSAP